MNTDELQTILTAHNIRPLPSLSQNFLLDEEMRDRIVAAGLTPDSSHAVEIGGGVGVLTEALLERFENVTVYEVDKTLSQILRERFYRAFALDIRHKDILEASDDFDSLVASYVVIANIPYHITNRLVRFLLARKNAPIRMILLVQQEVAERLTFVSQEWSLFRLSVDFYADVEYLFKVPKDRFYPQPEVDSAVVVFTPHEKFSDKDREAILDLAGYAFRQKRKKVRTSFSKQLDLSSDEIDMALRMCDLSINVRPQELSPENWCCLWEQLYGGDDS